MEGSISSQPEDGKGQTHPNSILSHRYQLCRSAISMTFSANAWSLTLRTEKITFCPGSRTRRFKTSEEMKGTLEPSAPSIIPNPCTSIFFTIPVILSVLPVQPVLVQHLARALVGQ